MRLVEFYARSEQEAEVYRDQLRRLGEAPAITVMEEDYLRCHEMPAIRTLKNFFEGEHAVSRVLVEVARRKGL